MESRETHDTVNYTRTSYQLLSCSPVRLGGGVRVVGWRGVFGVESSKGVSVLMGTYLNTSATEIETG